MSDFAAIQVLPKTGEEAFVDGGETLGFHLKEFWSWASSDLSNNALRGVLAEYLVGKALDCVGVSRVEWDAVDLITKQGTRIEVKSAAYCQTWQQQRHSAITFGIGPTEGLISRGSEPALIKKRWSDLYVFALLKHLEKESLNPLDLSQWVFYVLPTSVLEAQCPTQKKISLSALLKHGPIVAEYKDLCHTILEMEKTLEDKAGNNNHGT